MEKGFTENKVLTIRMEKSAGYGIFPHQSLSKGFLLLFMVTSMLFFLFQSKGFSSNYLHLSGWVVQNERGINNVTITVYDGDVLTQTMRTNYLGSFSVFLPFQKEFRFVFTKEGLITKSVIIDTRTPGDPDPEYYYFFRFEVELFEDNPNARREFFNDPVAIVYYDIGVEEFRFHRNNVKVHSTRARGRRAQEPQVWPFEDPESFFDYLMETVANPENVNIVADVPAVGTEPVSPAKTEEEQAETATKARDEEAHQKEREIIYVEYLSQPDNAKPSPKEDKPYAVSIPDEKTGEITPPAPTTHLATQPEIHKKDDSKPEDFIITFFDYRNASVKVDPGHEVFFSVQLLATAKYIPRGFFDRFLNNFPDAMIWYYHDHDELEKYVTGIFASLDEALEKHRKLRESGIEAYIVAFAANRRISVKQALSMLP